MSEKFEYILALTKQGDSAAQTAKELTGVASTAAQAESKLVSLTASYGKTALAAAGAVLSFQAVLAVLSSSVRAYEEQEQANIRLQGALRNTGNASAEAFRQLQAQASALQDSTAIADDAIQKVQASLLEFGTTMDEMPRFTQNVLDLAAAGYGLEASASAVGAAVAGNFSPLQRMLKVDFTDGSSRAETLAKALGEVEKRFKGLSAASAESLGGLKGTRIAMGELQERIGEVFLTAIDTPVKYWNQVLKNMMEGTPIDTSAIDAKRAQLRALNGAPGIGGPPDPQRQLELAENLQRQREDFSRTQALDSSLNYRHAISRFYVNDAGPVARGEIPGLLGHQGGQMGELSLYRAQHAQILEMLAGQKEQKLITEKDYFREVDRLQHEKLMKEASLAEQGSQIVEQSKILEISYWKQAQLAISNDFDHRRQMVEAYYETERRLAEENGEDTERITELKLQALERLRGEQDRAIFQTTVQGEILHNLSTQGAQQFASGFAQASVSFAASMGKNKEAFQEFAASFMQAVAQMIIQTLVLRAVSSILGSFGGGGGGGAPASAFPAYAKGGFAPRLAANGLLGVQEVNAPTYFPSYNVLAGEAGREMMAVFAQPKLMSIGGLSAMVGNVQGNQLAMMNYSDVSRTVTGNSGGGGSGPVHIHLHVSSDGLARAQVIDEAIEGAVVRVHSDISSATPLNEAVKGAAR